MVIQESRRGYIFFGIGFLALFPERLVREVTKNFLIGQPKRKFPQNFPLVPLKGWLGSKKPWFGDQEVWVKEEGVKISLIVAWFLGLFPKGG